MRLLAAHLEGPEATCGSIPMTGKPACRHDATVPEFRGGAAIALGDRKQEKEHVAMDATCSFHTA
jgi:hypothetical protein